MMIIKFNFLLSVMTHYSCFAAHYISPLSEAFDTKILGEITLISLKPEMKTQANPIICIPGMNEGLVTEWLNVASLLSTEYHVVILNLFTNPKTHPKRIEDDHLNIILLNIISDYFKESKAVIMGKSWGGQKAANFALQFSNMIAKVALIAPVGGVIIIPKLLETTEYPVFIGWAADDPITYPWSSQKWLTQADESRVTLFQIKSGGHVISTLYANPIRQFMQT